MVSKKTMEVNPTHPIVEALVKKADADSSDKTVKDLIWLMYDISLLTSGFSMDSPVKFADRIYRMVKLGLSIESDSESDSDLPDLPEKSDCCSNEECNDEDDSTMEEID